MSQRAAHRAQVRLQRSLGAIVIGSRQAERKLEAELAPLRGGDVTQVVHVPIQGKAGGVLATTELTVSLPQRFLTRILVAEDDVEPTTPTFTYGYELASDAPVEFGAVVRDWIEDDSGLIRAVRVRLSAYAPGATLQLPFNATAHLMFTGFAAPDGDEDDDQANPVPETPTSIPQEI
jgi:hypothetical protein